MYEVCIVFFQTQLMDKSAIQNHDTDWIDIWAEEHTTVYDS